MIKVLQIMFLFILYIIFRISISKKIGKEIRKDFFGESFGRNNIKTRSKENIKNIIVFLGIITIALLNDHTIVSAMLIGAGVVLLIYCIKLIKQNVYRKQILCDLLNISECLRVQISAQIPLRNALRNLPELCVNKEFAGLLTNIYLEYELSKFIILETSEELKNRFNYQEIKIFVSALNQQIQGTSALESLDNLILILKEKYIDFLEESTRNKMVIMTIGVFIIVINIAALGIYPIAAEAFNAINIMLK